MQLPGAKSPLVLVQCDSDSVKGQARLEGVEGRGAVEQAHHCPPKEEHHTSRHVETSRATGVRITCHGPTGRASQVMGISHVSTSRA